MPYLRIKRNRYVDETGFPRPHTGKNHAEDMQDFHLPLAQMQNASLLTWGVVRGLEVSGVLGSGTGVTIQPGVAIDGQGRLLVLAEGGFGDIGVDPAGGQHNEVATPVLLGLGGNSGSVYVTIQFSEILRANEGASGRLEQVPWLRLQPVAGFVDDGSSLILAVAQIDDAGLLAGLSERSNNTPVRRVVGQAAQAIELRRPTIVAGQVQEAAAARLAAGAMGGLHLTVPSPSDAITLARDDGERFATLELQADATHAHGNLQVDGSLRIQGTTTLLSPLTIGDLQAAGGATNQDLLTFAAHSRWKFKDTEANPDPLLDLQPLDDNHSFRIASQDGTQAPLQVHTANQPASNAVYLVQGGGNVGIGTTSPNRALTIHGNADTHLNLRANNGAQELLLGATPAGGIVATLTNHDLQLGAGNNTALTLKTNGNIGIGTALPNRSLTIAKTGATTGVYANLKNDTHEILVGVDSVAILSAMTASDLQLRTNNAPRLVIQANTGNVGIGTPSPQGRLDVQGDIRAGNSDLYFTKTDHNHTGIGNATGFAAIENAANFGALMILGRAGTARGRYVRLWDYLQINGGLDITGNLGVGTDAPGFRLDVADRMRVRQGGAGTAGIWFFQENSRLDRGFVGMAGDNEIGFWGNGGAGWALRMDVNNGKLMLGNNLTGPFVALNDDLWFSDPQNGTIQILNAAFNWGTMVGNFRAPSSIDYKKDVVPLHELDWSNLLEDTLKTGLVNFKYKGDAEESRPRLGVVVEQCPAYLAGEDGKSLSTVEYVAMLHGAIKALAQQLQSCYTQTTSKLDILATTVEGIETTYARATGTQIN